MHPQSSTHHHALILSNGSERVIALKAAVYPMGRDPANKIVLKGNSVSRQHATLLRIPVPRENRFQYQLLDGDSKSRVSTNGVFVNEQRCGSHFLTNGDIIGFGSGARALYFTLATTAEHFADFLELLSAKTLTIHPSYRAELMATLKLIAEEAYAMPPGDLTTKDIQNPLLEDSALQESAEPQLSVSAHATYWAAPDELLV